MHTRASSIPSRVRAREAVIRDGLVFAQAGDVGEVLDAETYPDGVRGVTVMFRDAPEVTTCFLGQDVDAVLTLLAPVADLVEPEPEPTRVQSARPAWPPRRAYAVGFAAGTAALLALLVWRACPPVEAPKVAALPTPGLARDVGLTDIAPLWGAPFGAPAIDSVPAQPEPAQKKPPCHPEFGETEISGACYAVMAMRPPCGRLYQWGERCVRPIIAAPRPDTSIRRE